LYARNTLPISPISTERIPETEIYSSPFPLSITGTIIKLKEKNIPKNVRPIKSISTTAPAFAPAPLLRLRSRKEAEKGAPVRRSVVSLGSLGDQCLETADGDGAGGRQICVGGLGALIHGDTGNLCRSLAAKVK